MNAFEQKDAKNMINIYDFDSKIKVEDIKELTKTLKYLNLVYILVQAELGYRSLSSFSHLQP